MPITISRQELLEKLGKLGYVKTQSGPVVPAKQELIDTITKGTPKPVGDQTKAKWDHRKYDNNPLNLNKNYLNLKDLGIKVMTESRLHALNEANNVTFKLDLPVMSQQVTSGRMRCLGHDIRMQMMAPNDEGEVTIILDDENTGNTTQRNFPADSDELKGRLDLVIKRMAMDMVRNGDTATDFDQMTSGVGAATGFVGNDNFNDVNFDNLNVAEMGPSALVKNESVDWQLQALLGLCNKAVLEAENDFGAEDFAAPTEGGEQPEQPADGNPPPMQDAGDVNANPGGTAEGAPKTKEFTEFCDPGPTDPGNNGLSQKAVDTLNKIIADAYVKELKDDSSGVQPDADEIFNGWAGTTAQPREVAVPTFLKFKKYAALGSQPLSEDGLVKMAKALEDGIDPKTFDQRLGTWFPEVYNADGTAINDVDAQTAAMQLPGDDQTGVGVGWSPNAQIGEPQGGLGGTGDMMSMADDMFGEPGTEMKEGAGDEGYDNVDFDLAALDKI